LVFHYAYRRRDRLFTFRDDVITPRLAWNALDMPVATEPAGQEAAAYDLLSLFRRRFREQRITVTPRLTPEAQAAGLRPGDPVPLALADRWNKSHSGLIVPAQVGHPVTVTLPRSDYALIAYGSPGERLFRAHDPYLAMANARVARERRSAIDVPLSPRAGQQALTLRALATPSQPTRFGVSCIYCGTQYRGDLLLKHMLECPHRPRSGLRSSIFLPPSQVPVTRPPAKVIRPRTPRDQFIDEIRQRGFWLGAGAKHIYYHDSASYPSRIVLKPTRIRFEICSKKTIGRYELWRSYSLVYEHDAALRAIPELKSKSRRALRG
jgi:hypothetical protein